jgi:hypothetical protein
MPVMSVPHAWLQFERRTETAPSQHPVRRASIPFIVTVAVFSRIFPSLLRYLWVVITRFFLPMFQTKFFPKTRRVVSVDHELDGHIPFEPDRVELYLSFIQIWVRAASLMRWQLGRKANRDISRFLHGLSDCYMEAWEVYRRCMSTTVRPAKAANRHFRMIYATDPHFCCIPSLHVMIVVYAVIRSQAIYERHDRMDLGEAMVEDLYQQAVDITETIIFVKQHSVNCISAALYMISNMYPRFGREQARHFIGHLFRQDLPAREFGQIDAYIYRLYERFMDDPRCLGGAYTDVLVDFLLAYAADPRLAASDGQA